MATAKTRQFERYRVMRSFDAFTEGDEFEHTPGDADLDKTVKGWLNAGVVRKVASGGVPSEDASKGSA